MNRISFHDTHVYPGCLAIFYFRITPAGTTLSALAEFSDGSTAAAEVGQVSPEEVFVRIDGYITTRGSNIPEKTWRLRYDNDQDFWKVVAKM